MEQGNLMGWNEVVIEHAEGDEVVRLLLGDFCLEIQRVGFNLGRFISEGDAYLNGFVNLLLEDFAALGADEVLAGANAYLMELDLLGGALSAADRRLLIAEALTQIDAASPAFTRGIAQHFAAFLQELRGTGMTDDTILEALTTSRDYLGRVLGRWENGIKDMARQFVTVLDDASYELAFERRRKVERIPNEHVWITRYDKNVCGRKETASAWRVSCWHRHGKKKSLNEWRKYGRPGSGVTYCRKRCRCLLAPVARVRDVDLKDPVKIGEAMEKAARRAERRARDVKAYAAKRAAAYQEASS
jgi:hypothetical protein